MTFRLKQTSKNRGTYRFYREGDGKLPICLSTPEPATTSGGHGDIGGHSHTLYMGEKNSDEKNKNKNDLNVLYIGERRTSLNVPMSPKGVFCTQRSDLDCIAIDLKDAERIALDIETYGPRKTEGDAFVDSTQAVSRRQNPNHKIP